MGDKCRNCYSCVFFPCAYGRYFYIDPNSGCMDWSDEDLRTTVSSGANGSASNYVQSKNPYLELLDRIDKKNYLTEREHREYMKTLTDALNDFYLMTKHKEEQDKIKGNYDNELYKLSWEWSQLMFEQRKDELGRNLTLDEMNQVAKEIVEEQERVLKESGAVNIEVDLSKYYKK